MVMRENGAIRGLLRLIDDLCTAGAWLAAVSAAALAAILIVEVFSISFFNWSQPRAVEYAVYLQCFVLFCGAGWTLRQGGHIRVGVLFQALPRRAAWLLDVSGSCFAIGVVGFAAWALWQQLIRTFDYGSISFYPMATPLWIPQGLLTVGVTFLLLAFVGRLIRLLINEPTEMARAMMGGGAE